MPRSSVFDELWGYTSERSRRLWDEMVPPPTRKIACRLTVTYAGFSGESVLLEELHKRGMAEPEVAPSLRAGDGLLMAWHTKPIAPWQTDSWLDQMRKSLRPGAILADDRQYVRHVRVVASSTWKLGTPASTMTQSRWSPSRPCRYGLALTPALSTTAPPLLL